MSARPRSIAALLFCSGACALVYQVSWLREFRLVFGASTAASAAVLAIFIGGLGFGALRLGRRADRHENPLAFYARLETGIAVAAAASPALLWLVRVAYVRLGGSAEFGSIGGSLFRLALAAVVLAPPTFLMGGTLPAAARAALGGEDGRRGTVALLYGVNTLGAVVGCFAATFSLLEVLGTRRTLWLAAAVNLLVAFIARSLSRDLPEERRSPDLVGAESTASAPRSFVLLAAAVVGFVFFLLELIWYRMLGPILGGTVFTFGLILAVALLGIGVGGALYSALGRGRSPTVAAFATTCILEAVFVALPIALGDRVALLAAALRSLGTFGFWGHVLGWTGVTFLVVLPVAIVSGFQFPLLIALLGRGRVEVGRHVGLAYAWNTGGAILGSLAGGFGLLPLLSAVGAWRLSALTLVALGALAVGLSHRQARRRALAAPIVAAILVLGMLRAEGPTAAWRHSGIGAGRSTLRMGMSANELRGWLNDERRATLWDRDGVESSVALQARFDGLRFVINGKTDGSARADAATFVMTGLLGAFLHPEPKSGLVIGLGTGSSAGWLAAVPSIERLDVVELEPEVLEVARACSAVNRDVLANPKVHVTIGDAREVLLTTPTRYDLVVSEPSNPYRAGIASLFTLEYYQAVRERLAENGLFLQWVQAYEVDAATLRTVMATLAAAFDQVEAWEVGPADLLLVGSPGPVRHDVARLRARLQQEPFRSGLRNAWKVTDLEGFLAHYVAAPSLVRAVAEVDAGGVNTDDLNRVEFGFAKSVGRIDLMSVTNVRAVALSRGEDRPPLDGGVVDWERVAEQRVVLTHGLLGLDWLGPEPRARVRAQLQYAAGTAGEALELWRSQPEEPRTPMEKLTVAGALAQQGREEAAPYIARLAEDLPGDALIVRAIWHARMGRAAEAAVALRSAFERLATDPWISDASISQATALAQVLGGSGPETATALFEVLERPFAVHVADLDRTLARAALSSRIGFESTCLPVAESLEPHVPWREDWLLYRKDCYQANADPRAPAAARDLAVFMGNLPMRLDQGLPAPRS